MATVLSILPAVVSFHEINVFIICDFNYYLIFLCFRVSTHAIYGATINFIYRDICTNKYLSIICFPKGGAKGREQRSRASSKMDGVTTGPGWGHQGGSGLDHQRAAQQLAVHRMGPGGPG